MAGFSQAGAWFIGAGIDVALATHTEQIRISIANDGVTVPGDIAPRIFDPYVSTKIGGDNMGLGLAIVRKIVIEHGGDIHYEQRRGSPAFVITLPRARA